MNDKQNCSARARALVKPSAYLKRTNEFLTSFRRPYRRRVVTASSAESSSPERVIVSYRPAEGSRGPRYRLRGSDRDYVRMNSNSYLSLSHHPKVLEAADAASHLFGAGPGAVRFIDGTFAPHVELESRIARFVSRPAARAFNSAYTTMLGVAITLSGTPLPAR